MEAGLDRSQAFTDDDPKSRLRALLGADKLARLEAARVLVVGIGGVGSAAATSLVRAGVGTVGFIDGDVVEASNINRQTLAFQSTIGLPKCQAMEELARNISPTVVLEGTQTFLTPDNLEQVMEGWQDADYVIDAIDTMATKVSMAGWAQAHQVPLVSSMGGANHFDPTRLQFADIHETRNCPMARAMRKACRKAGIDRLQVLFSDEVVSCNTQAQGLPLGTMSYLPPIMGEMLAGHVICRLLDIPWEKRS